MKINVMAKQNKEMLSEFESLLGYRFTDLRLLQIALIHSSFAFEQAEACRNNELLEFLGDAVLDLVVGYILLKRFPEMNEGELTRFRAALVNETHLAQMARKIELGRFLYLGKGEEASTGRNKSSILSCGYEAVVGAIFEDGGYESVAECVERFFLPSLTEKKEALLIADAKSRLQEVLQEKYNEAPHYRLEAEDGPSHQKLFTVAVVFRDEVLGRGTAGSKKEAEQKAAAVALSMDSL
ncbi:MAG: ribonuclease III [Desulfopila sp.]